MAGMIEILLRLVISMAVVMGVMALAARFVRRRQGAATGLAQPKRQQRRKGGLSGGIAGLLSPKPRSARPSPSLQVLQRQALTKNTSVSLLEVDGKRLLVGVTEQSVTLLAQLSAPAASPSPEVDLQADLVDLENLLGEGRTPAPIARSEAPAAMENAWKLALDSLRERTVRR